MKTLLFLATLLLIGSTMKIQLSISLEKEVEGEGIENALIVVNRLLKQDPRQCLQQHCSAQIESCKKDFKCLASLQGCERQCKGKDLACIQTCLNTKGNQAAIDFFKCGTDNKCFDQETAFKKVLKVDPKKCVQDNCKSQVDACKKDLKCIGSLQSCEKECKNNVTCVKGCLDKKGDKAAIALFTCGNEHGCFNSSVRISKVVRVDPKKCVQENCKSQVDACKKDLKCIGSLQSCEKECKNNVTCVKSCLDKKGNKAAIALFTCGNEHGCFNSSVKASKAIARVDPQECIEKYCPDQWNACTKDPKCVPALQDCQSQCGDKKSCYAVCLAKKGSQPAIAVAKCADANKCLGSSCKGHKQSHWKN